LSGCGSTPAPVQTVATAPVPQARTEPQEPEAVAQPLSTEQAEVSYQQVESESLPVAQDQDEQLQRDLLTQAKAALATDPKRTLAISYQLQHSLYSQIRAQNHLPLLQAAIADKQQALTEQLAAQVSLTDVPEADRQAFALALAGYYRGSSW